MNDIWNQFTTYAAGNEMFAGLVGASALASAVYMLRGLPLWLWFVLNRQLTVELKVSNTDEAFEWLSDWLAHQPYAHRARRLVLATGREHRRAGATGDREKLNWSLLPGEGLHWFLHKGRLVTMDHSIDRENSRGAFLKEYITLRTLGRRQDFLQGIIAEAARLRVSSEGVVVKVFVNGWWQNLGWKEPRPLESVILTPGQAKRILADAVWFFQAAGWYAERGIPYRRGYLFEGPPGTGKTSLVIALATALQRPLYALNLGSVANDDALINAFLSVPAGSLLLIEDVDVAKASHERTGRKKAPKNANEPQADGPDEPEGITLSGLLNAIDGAMAPDGRLLIMTTNHPDQLDKALVRAGRADLHEPFALLNRDGARRMWLRFGADDAAWNEIDLWDDWPRTAADVQQFLIERAGQ